MQDGIETEDSGGATSGGVEARQARGDPVATSLEAWIIEAISTVYDPEIPVNIYDLGLIYDIQVGAAEEGVEGRKVVIQMTLTSPACPVAEILPEQVAARVGDVEGVSAANVELVWMPPWTPERMTEAARLELGMM